MEAYTFLDTEDLEEILKLVDDMQEILFHIKKNGFYEEYFISLRSIFSMFCLTIRYYEQIAPVSTTITNFSNLINTNKDKFIKLNTDELNLVIGFINNIDNWVQTLFIKGGADINFMDNSIKADYEMIDQFINPIVQDTKLDLDDIFTF